MNWDQVKAKVDRQMYSDPQRGTLQARAIRQVEEGLQTLAGYGHAFEIAPKGSLEALSNWQTAVPSPSPEPKLPVGADASAVETIKGAVESVMVQPGIVADVGSEVIPAKDDAHA